MRHVGLVLWMMTACAEEDPDAWIGDPAPPVNPNLAVGRTYVLDLASLDFTQPVGGSMVLVSLLTGVSDAERAFTVLGARGGQVRIRLGDVVGGPGRRVQDPCALTEDVVLDDFGALWASRMASPLPGRTGPIDTRYRSSELAGRLTANGDAVDRIRFNAIADITEWQTVLGGPICPLFAGFGLACVPCPGGVGECIELESHDGVAAADPAVSRLQPVTAASRAALACP